MATEGEKEAATEPAAEATTEATTEAATEGTAESATESEEFKQSASDLNDMVASSLAKDQAAQDEGAEKIEEKE